VGSIRAVLKTILLLLALPLVLIGGLGVAQFHLPSAPFVAPTHDLLVSWLLNLGHGSGVERIVIGPLAYAPLLVGLVLVVVALRGGRRGSAEEVEEDLRPGAAPVDKKTRRRAEKQAETLAKKGNLAEAGTLLVEVGSLDRAAELYIGGELFAKAAEIRHDQNRFAESAELYQKAGRFDTAGTILSTQGDFAGAAECFAKANRLSVAAEMFEKAENHLRAGECYLQVGFARHAAQSFVKAQAWGKGAAALEEVITEEFARNTTGQDPKKQKELRTLVLQAGRLYEQAGNPEKALAVLERGSCFSAAGEIALRLERFAAAAELFQRAHEPLRAAEALQRLGEDAEAARILGEYHRDRGEDEEAAAAFERAKDWLAAGDLYRKLERYAEAGSAYEHQGDANLAAEMFRMAGDTPRAASMYERAGRYAEAAECFASVGDRAKEAELLERAGQLLKSGELYHELGRDDDAIKLLQKVEAVSPEFGPASALLGRIFRAKGMHSLAVKKLKQAIGSAELSRETVQAYYALAEVEELSGEVREAVDLYEKILAFDYHFADVEKRLATARAKAALLPAAESLSSQSSADRVLTPSSQPARYQIVGELGRGGMGIVYKANDTVLDRVVAFKVLPDALKENPQALKNFLREAKSAAQLNHPNIVTVYDAGEQDGRYYIAMEYVDGTTLKEILRRRNVIAASGVLHVLVQMCEALAYAHDKKIVHRDIKTANTMWTRDKKAKIMDFGLAKVVEEVRNHTTLVSGTPYYMSPEQTLGRNVDHRTDIYSLGVTIYELATGTLPFRDGNVPYHHVHTPAPDPRSVNPSLPVPLARIISRCLQKAPDDRYQSTREILTELRAAVSEGGLATKRAQP
jgi:tetratricopeptide (TPR) repeat protein